MLVKSACALTRVADNLVKSASAENKEQLKDILGALSLTLKTSHEISLDRRAKILNAPCVNKKYKKLGSSQVAITNWLFGDDLKASLAAIDSASKLGAGLSQFSKGHNFYPNQSKNGEWHDSLRVRGRGSGRSRGRFMRNRGFSRGCGNWQQKQSQV